MNKTMMMPYLTQIKKRNIKTEAGNVTLKYINPIKQSKEELIERLKNAPHLNELLSLFDSNIHKKIIIQCNNINNGISAVGQIACLMCDFIDRDSVMESDVIFDDDDDIFFDFEEPDNEIDDTIVENSIENFAIMYESEFDTNCNSIGETITQEQMLGKPKLDYSDFKNIIFVADGLFTLTEKSINFLQGFNGNVAVVLPESNKNTSAIQLLTFESDFETIKINNPNIDYFTMQFINLVKERGYKLNKKLNIKNYIRQLINYRGHKFQEYDLSIYLDKNIKNLKGSTKEINELISLKDTVNVNKSMDDIIGLDEIKDTIYKEIYKNVHINQMEEKGHKSQTSYKHIAFEGNPGTCKTTMARAVAELYQKNNIISNGFYEFGREDLVGRYLGETSQKISRIFRMAKGGVIFIDEFGAIVSDTYGDSYGIEALNALVRHMENNPDTIVIVATYPGELKKILSINPGLQSRFSKIINFPDYTQEELLNIFEFFAIKNGYTIEKGYEAIVLDYFEKIKCNNNFGNGREARKLFEASVSELSLELFNNNSKEIDTLTISSIRNAISSLSNSNKPKFRIGFSQI